MSFYIDKFSPFLFVLLVVAAPTCSGAPPAAQGTQTDAKESESATESSAPRDVKFVLEDEPWLVKLDDSKEPRFNFGNATKEQLDKQFHDELAERYPYAAILRGYAPLLELTEVLNGEQNFRPLTFNELRQLSEFDSSPACERLLEFTGGSSRAQFSRGQFSVFILPCFQARLIADYQGRIHPSLRKHVTIPQGSLFTMALQRTAGRNRSWQINIAQFAPAPEGARPLLQEYAFLAGSVEDAKQLAKDFLDVYDRGFVPQVTKLAKKAQAKLVASRDEIAPRLTKLKQQDAAAEEELQGVEELSETAISDLKVKRSLLKVELAGVQARVAAIEAKLKEQDGPASRLVEMKVAADIDLAGLAAQRKVLDQMIDGQSRRAELSRSREKELKPLQERADYAARYIQRCDEILADLVPFQLVDDSIIIRPTKFE